MRRIALSIAFCLCALLASAQQQRHFTVTYKFTVRNVTPGSALRVWFPMAHSDRFQQVKLIDVTGDLPVERTTESEYGNRIFYARAPHAAKGEYSFEARYDVLRFERRAFDDRSAEQHRPASQAELARFVRADHLVPVSGVPAQLAAEETTGKTDPLSRARAIYDYVFRTMRYDKTGTGWGRGDSLWACDAKRGNCTDFHSLFASMARSQHIPTRFEIGLPLPTDKHDGEIAGYHCWSDFYVAQYGWVPIDISEAWKHQEKKDYFFGSHDVNRVQFSVGRDIALSPRQTGEPLNYFIYPYVEVDGKKYEQVDTRFSFADENVAAGKAAGQ
jgi:transglutaminase-like putative cysteine protease